ncbi:MAG TPA: methyltransferase domain-containing protein, partial [Longimicrobiaceae bacterium]|nr:methyltransferase domain-containing protein [Longimicrobiaceae bacterium]
MTATTVLPAVDVDDLRARVRDMYDRVAREPAGEFHFEMGRALAVRLGYQPADLDRIPAEAIESFAGVGYHLGLAALRPGETVLDLGSGSGMDVFAAALQVRPGGRVIGVDMTDAQLAKAAGLRDRDGFAEVEFRRGLLEELVVDDGSVDVVISNGVINLCADKERVFREAARVLRPGGRLAISDIVTASDLPEGVTCDATLWAACIGGAVRLDRYTAAIEAAGLRVERIVENPQYQFLTRSAQGASAQYGVRSVSLLARA